MRMTKWIVLIALSRIASGCVSRVYDASMDQVREDLKGWTGPLHPAYQSDDERWVRDFADRQEYDGVIRLKLRLMQIPTSRITITAKRVDATHTMIGVERHTEFVGSAAILAPFLFWRDFYVGDIHGALAEVLADPHSDLLDVARKRNMSLPWSFFRSVK
ncbi:MAG: hypothetical protein ACYC26_07050 [Phycisphaerales bacterium]